MGRWRGRRLFAAPRPAAGAMVCGLAAVVLAGTGCGSEQTANDPRPQSPTRVSVAVSEGAISVQPPRVAVGPEQTQQLPQNQHATQPAVRSKAPLNVVLVAANLTDVDSRLELRGNGENLRSQPLYANATVTLQAILPTGAYRVATPGIPGTKPARLVIGPYRSSSESDLLLP